MRRTLATLTMAGGAGLLFVAGAADILRLNDVFGPGTGSERFGPAQVAGCILGGALFGAGWWTHRRCPPVPAPAQAHETAPGA